MLEAVIVSLLLRVVMAILLVVLVAIEVVVLALKVVLYNGPKLNGSYSSVIGLLFG